MEYEKSASGSVYLIKSDKGYWLPGGFGYTSNKAEAGRFSVADMASLNLDGCMIVAFLFKQCAECMKNCFSCLLLSSIHYLPPYKFEEMFNNVHFF